MVSPNLLLRFSHDFLHFLFRKKPWNKPLLIPENMQRNFVNRLKIDRVIKDLANCVKAFETYFSEGVPGVGDMAILAPFFGDMAIFGGKNGDMAIFEFWRYGDIGIFA